VLGKLWSVAPKLFEWPPVKSPAQALERLSILLIVGSILFLMVTGAMNVQYDYAWGSPSTQGTSTPPGSSSRPSRRTSR
jgi:hypothetical protein